MNTLPRNALGLATLQGLAGWLRVLQALIRRDIIARYGRQNIGFLWLIVEPMILTLGVMILWSFAGTAKGPLPIIPFVLTGYTMITLWRHMTNCGIFFVRRSAGLLYHRQISFFDIFISRIFVEFAGSTLAAVVLYFFVRVLGLSEPVEDIATLALAWFLMGLLATGIAALIAAGSESLEALDRLIPALQYLVLPLSGCFFMMDWLPVEHRQIILAVPLVHAFEMFRDGYFGSSVTTHYSASYLFTWIVILNAAGLWAVERARDFAQVR